MKRKKQPIELPPTEELPSTGEPTLYEIKYKSDGYVFVGVNTIEEAAAQLTEYVAANNDNQRPSIWRTDGRELTNEERSLESEAAFAGGRLREKRVQIEQVIQINAVFTRSGLKLLDDEQMKTLKDASGWLVRYTGL